MLAAVHCRGEIVVREVARPAAGAGEVVVRVRAASVCAADYRIAGLLRTVAGRAVTAWRRRPVVLGLEMAGRVEAVGEGVTRLRVGDEVFGGTGPGFGAQAESVRVEERRLEKKPATMRLEEAAAVAFGAMTALSFLRRAGVGAGQRVLVYGASGSVGVFAVQLAKHFGARVTGVASGANLEMVRGLGADEVVDYTREDFSSAGRVYDAVIDTVGYAGFRRTLRAIKRGGAFARIAPSGGLRWARVLALLPVEAVCEKWVSMRGGVKVIGGLPRVEPGDLEMLKGLIEAGEVRTVIDRVYRLEQVAEAYRYAGTGHKRGHVLIEF